MDGVFLVRPAVPVEQPLDTRADVDGEVVLGDYALFSDDELPLFLGMRVNLRMPHKTEPLTRSQVTNAAFAMKGFGCVFETRHLRVAQRGQIKYRVAQVRCRDVVVLEVRGKLVSSYTLVHLGCGLDRREGRRIGVLVIGAVQGDPAGL